MTALEGAVVQKVADVQHNVVTTRCYHLCFRDPADTGRTGVHNSSSLLDAYRNLASWYLSQLLVLVLTAEDVSRMNKCAPKIIPAIRSNVVGGLPGLVNFLVPGKGNPLRSLKCNRKLPHQATLASLAPERRGQAAKTKTVIPFSITGATGAALP